MTHTELQGVREHGHRGRQQETTTKQTTTNKQDREASTERDRDGERESGSQGVRNARHL
jgi:hypothetical protein